MALVNEQDIQAEGKNTESTIQSLLENQMTLASDIQDPNEILPLLDVGNGIITFYQGTTAQLYTDYSAENSNAVFATLANYGLDIYQGYNIQDSKDPELEENIRETMFPFKGSLALHKRDFHRGNPQEPYQTELSIVQTNLQT